MLDRPAVLCKAHEPLQYVLLHMEEFRANSKTHLLSATFLVAGIMAAS